MELLYTLPVAILVLLELIRLRKEIESKNDSIAYYIKRNKFISSGYEVLEKELKEEKKSNSANQGWNIKYRKTIEELEEKNQDQADTIKRLINKKGQ